MISSITTLSQSISRDVAATLGSSFELNEVIFQTTLGQPIVGYVSTPIASILQGFHKPNIPQEIEFGCTNDDACNYNQNAIIDDDSCDYISCYFGCTDPNACNFDSQVIADDGSCDFSCCPGPGCCNDGTHWDELTETCVVTFPADINFDGCVQLNDLLDLLSEYGGCVTE